ncbi:MAG: tetratricopeptide repeat protein, partial [Prevotellaceae bacterium]|nr:tetratricopeptide repeat protein [Prevotellaceae bacterium]
NNLGVLQRNINELQQAEASYREALQTYRELAANNPQAYLPDLAMTLNNLGILQSDINDYTKAEASYREALQIRRELAASNPRAYLPDVAMTIASLALFYQADVPDKEQSVRYAEEVLSYRSSIEHIPAAREYIEIAEAALERWQSH